MCLQRLSIVPVLTLCSLWLAGCGRSSDDAPNVVLVTGKVLKAGQPLTEASVAFIPDSGGAPSYGYTDTQGVFELTYNDGRPGAVPGSHTVVVTTGAPDPEVADAAASGHGPPPRPLAEPKEYRQTATVSGEGAELTIDLGA